MNKQAGFRKRFVQALQKKSILLMFVKINIKYIRVIMEITPINFLTDRAHIAKEPWNRSAFSDRAVESNPVSSSHYLTADVTSKLITIRRIISRKFN